MKDALGNEIVFGEWYGYTQSNNGMSHITFGKAVKETPTGMLTLETTEVWGIGYQSSKVYKASTKGKTTVRSLMVFPVDILKVTHFEEEK